MLLVDLETDEQFQLPFRQGFSRFSDDLALMAVDWSFVDDVPGKIEIWDTDACGKYIYIPNPLHATSWCRFCV